MAFYKKPFVTPLLRRRADSFGVKISSRMQEITIVERETRGLFRPNPPAGGFRRLNEC